MKTNKIPFDTTALRARILEKYSSLDEFAAAAGMKPEALISRLDRESDFFQHEIVRIRDVLDLNTDEVREYFFTPERTSEIELLNLESIIKRLEQIEHGIIALDLMATGQIINIGDTITNEDFQGGFRFIMEGILEQMTDLRADLTAQYARRLSSIGQ